MGVVGHQSSAYAAIVNQCYLMVHAMKHGLRYKVHFLRKQNCEVCYWNSQGYCNNVLYIGT